MSIYEHKLNLILVKFSFQKLVCLKIMFFSIQSRESICKQNVYSCSVHFKSEMLEKVMLFLKIRINIDIKK